MTRASYEVAITRGDCFDFVLTYKANDAAVNLTGYTAEMAIAWAEGFTGKRGSVGSTTWRSGAVSVPGTVTAGSGQVAFHMSAAETTAMPPISEAAYQVRLTGADGCTTTILGGKAKVYRDLFEEV